MSVKRVLAFFGVLASLGLGSIPAASANVGQEYSFGSRAASLGGAVAGGGSGAFATYHNPAGLSLETEKRFKFGLGLIVMEPNFLPITNVVTQNKYNADAVQYSDVDTSYKTTLGQELGLSYRLLPETWNLTVGFVAFFPVNQLAYMDTGETYVPEYVLYRARTQRPQVEFATGVDLGSGWHLGAGLHFAFTLTSNASVFINTRANTASSMRFTSSLKPKLAPYLGLLYAPAEDPKAYSVGLVFRFPVTSDNTMTLNSAARVFGDFAAVDFNFLGVSALFYDPMAIELGGTWQMCPAAKTYLQLEYQFWKKFEAPALIIQQPQTTNCQPAGSPECGSVQIMPGELPSYTYSNLLVPRIGEEIQLSDVTTLRFGYAYRSSIFSDHPTGAGNYVDPSKHMLNMGLGLKYPTLAGLEIPWSLDFNFAFQYLVRQNITKTPGNEKGDLTDPKIGSPGYTAGGNIVGGGVTLSLAI
jgi:long-subunit fatty acid transport protein